MRKLTIAAVVAAGLIGASAPSAQAAETVAFTGPCATQQALFEKYNIQIDMYAPAVSALYGTICNVTDDRQVTPCAEVRSMMNALEIELAMHFPLLEDTIREVCGVTG